ncbi:LPXTG cell wall anchor domain-containing protein [Kitasatospora griseola]|uniref:LPXTG cell wall anchor domain-containing protein n=1 Tax=Kitasatospora griseola TaxID=2064 RepID=UPI0037F9F55D
MSIRRSIAAAVFVAAVSAPTALGAAPALAADTAPTPTGQSQPDAPVTDTPAADAPATEAPAPETPAAESPAPEAPAAESPAPEAPAPETPATDPGTGTPAPGGSSSQELDDLRVRLLRVMAEAGHSQYFQERASKALDGTAEDIRHFLDVEMPKIIRDDKRIQVLRIIGAAGQGTPVWQAGQKALDGDDAAIDHFLRVEWPELVAMDRRGKVFREMIRPGSTLTLNEAAARVLDADELKAFLADLDTIDETGARITIARAMSIGGPEVREAANRALDSHDLAYLRSFLLTGLAEAQARDTANAKVSDANWGKVLHALIRPGSSLTLTEAAEQALGVDAAKGFLAGLDGISDDEIRLRISQAMSIGGPEVRTAVGHVLDGHTSASLRAFLLTGLAEAQARDTANAHQPEGGNQGTGTTPGQGGTTVTPVSDTTTTTVTTTATGVLASTGVDAPLGAITAAGAASVALGAALVAARRRRQQS